MSNKVSVLMFHALKKTNAPLVGADEHYAMDCNDYDSLIFRILEQKIKIQSIRNIIDTVINDDDKFVVFTFDDGHVSNYEDAFQKLKDNNCSADFFINSAFVSDPGYMNWSQILDMHNSGMSIQSHGHHHYYFDELDKKTIIEELDTSKKTLEDKIGHEVTIFAPPGGRITPEVKDIAFELGYKVISTSRPGVWTVNTSLNDVPRLPVLDTSSVDRIMDWTNQEYNTINKVVAKYYITKVGKKILGNKAYDKLREIVLS